jgi:toxin-antitoxin system PIN domain toxin
VSKPTLLDVNVLVALFDPDHIHHDTAHEWFAAHRSDGWATCPLTELALVRILSNPTHWPGAERSAGVLERLRQFRASGNHQFWRDSLELTDDIFNLSLLKGHRQLTAVYLLGLAVRRNGCLATFDRSIPTGAVSGAERETLLLIGGER